MDDWERKLKEERFWQENYRDAAEWFATAEYEHRNCVRRVKNVLIACVIFAFIAISIFKGQRLASGVLMAVVPITMWLFGRWRWSGVLHLDKELESRVPFQRIGKGSKYSFEEHARAIQGRRGYSPFR